MKKAIDIPQFIPPPRSGSRHYISQSAGSGTLLISDERRLNTISDRTRLGQRNLPQRARSTQSGVSVGFFPRCTLWPLWLMSYCC